MSVTIKCGNVPLRLEKGDITDSDIEAFVFYADANLKLGSGFGNAISMRGGLSIQKELDNISGAGTEDVVITEAGGLKAKYILHAVGPKFQEENLKNKLINTINNTLKLADEKGIKQLAFPAMGVGFYGVPLNTCAEVMIGTIKQYIKNGTKIEEVIIMALDSREYKPFAERLEK